MYNPNRHRITVHGLSRQSYQDFLFLSNNCCFDILKGVIVAWQFVSYISCWSGGGGGNELDQLSWIFSVPAHRISVVYMGVTFRIHPFYAYLAKRDSVWIGFGNYVIWYSFHSVKNIYGGNDSLIYVVAIQDTTLTPNQPILALT